LTLPDGLPGLAARDQLRGGRNATDERAHIRAALEAATTEEFGNEMLRRRRVVPVVDTYATYTEEEP
jgi:hypothetical protein